MLSGSYYLICVIIVMVIAGVYYVRVVQWIYYGDLIWQKIFEEIERGEFKEVGDFDFVPMIVY